MDESVIQIEIHLNRRSVKTNVLCVFCLGRCILELMRRTAIDLSDAFASVVKKHREAKKVSRAALAEKAGLHQTYIGLLERVSLDSCDRRVLNSKNLCHSAFQLVIRTIRLEILPNFRRDLLRRSKPITQKNVCSTSSGRQATRPKLCLMKKTIQSNCVFASPLAKTPAATGIRTKF